jgi:formylglycine-generating enzyme required for sulfatase activity
VARDIGASRLGAAEWKPPTEIDEYRLVREIGRGAMGQVYLAEDTLLERPVAVKFIADAHPDEDTRRRFFVEARAVARLSHPNVVAVHRVGEIDGRPYLVTELVRGRSLADVPLPLPEARIVAIALGIARGLGAAHDKGVLHRDIKPGNVMLTDSGEVKILDFGLAKIAAPVEPAAAATDTAAPAVSGDQSMHGGVTGTPLYMAPEALAGEPATRRSDLYSVGALLYELATGVVPRETLPPDASFETWVGADGAAPLSARAPGLSPGLVAAIERCLQRDPAARFATARALEGALAALTQDGAASAVPEGNPYRGLTPFEADHRAFFFGREAEARAVLDRLQAGGLVVVTGDSGVGKSSLCRAGVLPLVTDGALGDGRRHVVATLVPGRRPLATLAAVLASSLGLDEAAVAREAREDPAALARAVRAALGRERGFLLFVDQSEELITLADAEEAPLFAETIAGLPAVAAGVRVLVTVRGDYFTRLAVLPGLGDELARSLYLLRPLSPEGVRAAITGPASKKGVTFDPPALVDELATVIGSAGGLPLLQFALAELWEARGASPRITAAALEAIGGVEGALARHADDVLRSLGAEARAAARRVLLRLVTAEGTRARRTEAELDGSDPATRAALEALVRGRLVVAGESTEATSYELAHEALLDRWATLRAWLDEGGARRALAERVDAAAVEWERLGRAPEALWSGRRLDEVKALEPAELSNRARALIEASQARERSARRRRIGLALAGPLAVALALGGLRYKSARDLDRLVGGHVAAAEAQRAEGRAKLAEADDRRKKAYVLFDAATGKTTEEVTAKKDEAERVWAEALERTREAEAKLVRAGQSLEAALALDPGRTAIRAAIGDVTMERLALAEAFHAEERRADLMLRLAAYDPDGSRQRALATPPVVSISTMPPGAAVTLERYEDRNGRKVPVLVGELGTTPIRDVKIGGGPGSYRLLLKAPGRVEVKYPVLLGAGERFEVEVPLPAEKEVPEGYVYVPAGRFLVGSTDPEPLRRGFMVCSPLHEARTDAFYIARTEVTIGEWLAFLDALDADERAKRIPSARTRTWGVEYTWEPSAGWRLALTLNGVRHEARRGEVIRFSGRTRHTELHWERSPVAAVSLEDVEAYFHWLGAVGKVPGARPCSDWEWERAARGADARAYPHGDLLTKDDANFDETYGRNPLGFGPDEVGSYPASGSPFGLLDMAGNVLELTRGMSTPDEATMRGGAWYYESTSALIPNRTVAERQTRDYLVGVRGCADVVKER